jgi:amino acid transporter
MRRSLTYWVRLTIAAVIFVGSLVGAAFLTGYLGIREPYQSLIVISTGLVMGLLAFSIALIASKRYNR